MLRQGSGIYIALVVAVVTLVFWVRWMIAEPYWLEVFR